ncbi:hypothetical protein V6N13_020234 [Hibiscus sabdariffa]
MKEKDGIVLPTVETPTIGQTKQRNVVPKSNALVDYVASFSFHSAIGIGTEKHGTCSSPVIRDEYTFFLTALNVYFKYNVTKILNEAGYVPSNSERYPLGGIVSAIENSFRATPEVICSKHDVEEIRLCFYKDFKPRNCLASKTSCPKYVSLPTYVALGHNESDAAIEWISGDEAL